MCERSKSDPAYPKYPRLPVLECPGYEQLEKLRGGGGEGRRG